MDFRQSVDLLIPQCSREIKELKKYVKGRRKDSFFQLFMERVRNIKFRDRVEMNIHALKGDACLSAVIFQIIQDSGITGFNRNIGYMTMLKGYISSNNTLGNLYDGLKMNLELDAHRNNKERADFVEALIGYFSNEVAGENSGGESVEKGKEKLVVSSFAFSFVIEIMYFGLKTLSSNEKLRKKMLGSSSVKEGNTTQPLSNMVKPPPPSEQESSMIAEEGIGLTTSLPPPPPLHHVQTHIKPPLPLGRVVLENREIGTIGNNVFNKPGYTANLEEIDDFVTGLEFPAEKTMNFKTLRSKAGELGFAYTKKDFEMLITQLPHKYKYSGPAKRGLLRRSGIVGIKRERKNEVFTFQDNHPVKRRKIE